MTNQVTNEGLTDDQMNEHCHLAITELLATAMKKRYIFIPSYMLVNTFVHMASKTVSHKINFKCFFLKKTFYDMYRYNNFYCLLEQL